jgi:hypothetical protein
MRAVVEHPSGKPARGGQADDTASAALVRLWRVLKGSA